nr:unnamed protein product [Callosobruchus analis]
MAPFSSADPSSFFVFRSIISFPPPFGPSGEFHDFSFELDRIAYKQQFLARKENLECSYQKYLDLQIDLQCVADESPDENGLATAENEFVDCI